MPNKIDSNVTGLRYAEEVTPAVLPGSPVWYPLEPNSYDNFGGNLTTQARTPISQGRQRQKGNVVDLDAAGGFQNDLTQNGLTRLLQGFFFADIREKYTTAPMNSAATVITGVTGSSETYAAASGLSNFLLNDLLLASGFSVAANNGLKTVASSTSGTVVVTENISDETPPATAKLEKVGHQFATATVDVTVVGGYPRLNRASGTKDFTTFGLLPGEWVYVGGDAAGKRFVNAVNGGFARVRAVAATYIEFDKTSTTWVAETGTGLTVQMFFGSVLKNEVGALIKRRTYQLERTLGEDGVGTQSEYLVNATPNQLTFNIPTADKVTLDLSFIAGDHEQRTGTQGLKTGTRPAIVPASAFNTSSDFSRIKLHTVTAGNANPSALFAFLSDMSLTINNNVNPQKAVGVLGSFDVNVGNFEVAAELEAYFADVAAISAVRANADVTLDFALVKANAGMVWDIPLIALGQGRLDVEQDSAIRLGLSADAAESANNYTLMTCIFPYLPNAADS